MKIIHRDYKKGIIKLMVNDNEDLWTLKQVITPGDEVSGKTSRVIKKEDRPGERKKVWLRIKAEKIDFRKAAFILKVLGPIIEGPDDVSKGSYHSFNIDEGTKITIKKNKWGVYVKKRLEKSERQARTILIVIMDTREVTLALLNNEVKELFSKHAQLPRKDQGDYDKRASDYYKKTAKDVNEAFSIHEAEHLIIAGPGFAPKELMKVINPELKEKTTLLHTNHTGVTGVKELIRSDSINKVINESEVTEETRLVEEFFKQVSRDKLINYGLNQVSKAVNAGAVKQLLISEKLIIDYRQRKKFKEIEEIINKAEQTGASVEFIGTRHEAGKRFHKFSGIGAFLRYKL